MASQGLVAIVTGAARGIGYAISDILLKEGYKVCLADVNAEKGEESLDQLQKKYAADKLIFLKCDVSSKANLEEVFTKTEKKFGRIDLVVNNAGITDEYDFERMVAINLMGTIYGTKLALKFMGTSNGRKGGVVINIASIVGVLPFATIPVYAATKHGVVGLTRSYGDKFHLDQSGVIFMAICPYYVQTPMLQSAKPLVALNREKLPTLIQAERVAEGVVKLLEDRLNGSTLMILPEGLKYIELQDELKDINL